MSEPMLIIFDVDGTLVDSQHMIVAALTSAFAEEGLALPDRKEMLSVVGLSLIEAMERLAPGDPEQHVRLATAYKDAFSSLRQDPANAEPLFDGALEAICDLAARDECLLGIATGKSRRGVHHLFERFDLHDSFHTVQTADDHPSKPHPSMVRQAIAETGAAPARSIVVGDTVFDMEMARAAGAGAIGVSWGYHDAEHLPRAGAHTVIDGFADLVPAVERILNASGKA